MSDSSASAWISSANFFLTTPAGALPGLKPGRRTWPATRLVARSLASATRDAETDTLSRRSTPSDFLSMTSIFMTRKITDGGRQTTAGTSDGGRQWLPSAVRHLGSVMRKPGVEPGRVAPQDPKSCASASSATFAWVEFTCPAARGTAVALRGCSKLRTSLKDVHPFTRRQLCATPPRRHRRLRSNPQRRDRRSPGRLRTRFGFGACDTCRGCARPPSQGQACAAIFETRRSDWPRDTRVVAARQGRTRARHCMPGQSGSQESWLRFLHRRDAPFLSAVGRRTPRDPAPLCGAGRSCRTDSQEVRSCSLPTIQIFGWASTRTMNACLARTRLPNSCREYSVGLIARPSRRKGRH